MVESCSMKVNGYDLRFIMIYMGRFGLDILSVTVKGRPWIGPRAYKHLIKLNQDDARCQSHSFHAKWQLVFGALNDRVSSTSQSLRYVRFRSILCRSWLKFDGGY